MNHHKITYAIIGALTILVLTLSYFQFSTNSKLVYIDSNKLLANYQGMKDAQADFQKKAAVWQANVDTLVSGVQASIIDYEKESLKMTKKEKGLSRELIRTKQKQLQDYQTAIRDKSAQEDQQMTQQVLLKINSFLTTYGKEKDFQIIFGATSAGNIIYANEAIDITDEVLKTLNSTYQKM